VGGGFERKGGGGDCQGLFPIAVLAQEASICSFQGKSSEFRNTFWTFFGDLTASDSGAH